MIPMATYVSIETSVTPDCIMLIRHANSQISTIAQFGVSIEDYTKFQPEGGRFDFHCTNRHRPAEIAVVIVADHVHEIYRIGPHHQRGSSHDQKFVGRSYWAFQQSKDPRILRKFDLTPIANKCNGQRVSGYAGRERNAALHSGTPMFWEIGLDVEVAHSLKTALDGHLEREIEKSTKNRQERLDRLSRANPTPKLALVSSYVMERNPDVIAEALYLANGKCQSCGSAAPFIRRSDHSPYLEVHHRVPLAEGGPDTVENAIALCPNCHRRFHFGDWTRRSN
ncbi:HNH endonuclease [Leptothrix discophora]|uniref:HNH endonuclease signature motif containing protein n=1 Tax=Leptothrix discophora TaxID=89 RepID=A0ABT9G913_LEPDI|nr:HNH endonuclease signature motif containing protein [Leptothrix discophora]MDP4302962.1 HNH endonuclease signature motif containing protein [Leptothrix discophora]